MDFVEGWLSSRDVPVRKREVGGRTCLLATVGGGSARVVLHGHLDVVPGHPEQFSPTRSAGRLVGRGAYDMKGALAAMMLVTADLARGLEGLTLELLIVPDEERGDPGANCTEMLVSEGMRADFVICGEPTDLQVGVQAKGVLMMRAEVAGTAAHGSTPWLGDNAVLRAVDLFRRIETLPFAGESTPLFTRPSINLGRITGGDAVNKVPDRCRMDIDVRYLPGQDPGEIAAPGALAGAGRPGDPARASAGLRGPGPPHGPRAARRPRLVTSPPPPRSGGTAPRTPSPSSGSGCRRWSSAPAEGATTGRTSTWTSGAWPATGGPSGTSPAWWPPARPRRPARRERHRHPPASAPADRGPGPAAPAAPALRSDVLPHAAPAAPLAPRGRLGPLAGRRRPPGRGLRLVPPARRDAPEGQPGHRGRPRRRRGHRPRPARPAGHPAPDRLGPAAGPAGQGRHRAQRLAHPGPHGLRPRLHLDALVPAGPLRRHPGPRAGQDQRGLLARRPGQDHPDRARPDRSAHQLLPERRLRGLLPAGKPGGRGLRGRGPPLLQRQLEPRPRGHLRQDRPQARIPAPERRRRPGLRPLPAHRL